MRSLESSSPSTTFVLVICKSDTCIPDLINETAAPNFKIVHSGGTMEGKKLQKRDVPSDSKPVVSYPFRNPFYSQFVPHPRPPIPDSRTLFLYFSLILSLDLASASSSSSRAGARRREIRPRKGTKGGDKGKRRPRDTRTMDAEQWAAAGNSTDDEKRPLRTNYFPACAFHRILFRSSR